MFPNAAIFVTIKSQTSGCNQLSHKLGTSTLSAGLKLAVARYQPLFPYCICKRLAIVFRLATLSSVYVCAWQCLPSWFHYFGVVFVSSHLQTYTGFTSKLSHNILLPFPHHIPWAIGCILHGFRHLYHHERHFMFIHSTYCTYH